MADQKTDRVLDLDPFDSLYSKEKKNALDEYFKKVKDGMTEVQAQQEYYNELNKIELRFLKDKIGELEREKQFYINKGGLLKNNLAILELEVQIGEKTAKLYEKEMEYIKEKIKNGEQIDENEEKILKTLEKQKSTLETIVAIQKKRNEADKALGKNMLSDMEKLGIGLKSLEESTLGSMTAKFYNTLSNAGKIFGTVVNIGKEISNITGDTEKLGLAFKNLGIGALENIKQYALSVVAISDAVLGRILKDINESFIDVIKSSMMDSAKFSQIAGSSNEEFYNILEKQNEILGDTTRFAILQKDLRESAIELEKNNTLFNRLGTTAKANLAISVTEVSRFNVSMATSSKLAESMQRGFRNTSTQAGTSFNLMTRTALAAGIDINKMFSSAEANFSKFVGYGEEEGLKMFLDLEKTAKATGVAVENLFAITAKYDTFTGAAEAAGSLNAVLGGDFVNSLELVNANEQERIMLIKQGIDAAGIDFTTTDRRMKQAIMSAAGISDMNDATRLLGASTQDLTMLLAQDAATQEEANKASRDAADVARKYQSAIDNIARILMPVAEALGEFAEFMTQSSFAVYGTILALGLLGAAFTIFKIRYMSSIIDIATASKTGGVAGAVADKAKEVAKDAAEKIADAADTASPVAKPDAGAGIASFLTGLSTGLKTFANPQVVLGAGALALSLALFGAALVGIGIIISKYFKDGDFSSLLKLGAAIGLFALGAAGLGLLSGPILLGSAAIAALGAALVIVGAGLLVTSEAISKGTRSIESLIKLDLSVLAEKTEAVEAFLKPFNLLKEIPANNMLSIKTVFETIGKMPEISEGKKTAVVEIMEAAAKYQIAVAKTDETMMNKLIDVLAKNLNVNLNITDKTSGGISGNAAMVMGAGR